MGMTDQSFEESFWGDCANTFGEETKQLVYADRMGLRPSHDGKAGGPYSFDMMGRSVIDWGGGPCSMLLKMRNLRAGYVVDPGQYPKWVETRYQEHQVFWIRRPGELVQAMQGLDISLVYNVLQHVEDPEQVVRNARSAARTIGIFEWIDIPPHQGHPHMLTARQLEAWTGRGGKVEEFTGQNGCFGRAWYCPL